jgi:hypothetical protein
MLVKRRALSIHEKIVVFALMISARNRVKCADITESAISRVDKLALMEIIGMNL